MRSKVRVIAQSAVVASVFIAMFMTAQPASAVLEGSNRERLEYLDYSEKLIKETIGSKQGANVYSKGAKKYIRGVKQHNEPMIYEPDVYTWRLAMEEHKRHMQTLAPPEMPEITAERQAMRQQERNGQRYAHTAHPVVMPVPTITAPPSLPENPMPVFMQVTPVQYQSVPVQVRPVIPTQPAIANMQPIVPIVQQNFAQQPIIQQPMIPAQPIQQAPKVHNLPILPPQRGYTMAPFVEQTIVPGGQPYVIQSCPYLPGGSTETMNNMLNRARVRGIYPSDPLRGQEIRQSLGQYPPLGY